MRLEHSVRNDRNTTTQNFRRALASSKWDNWRFGEYEKQCNCLTSSQLLNLSSIVIHAVRMNADRTSHSTPQGSSGGIDEHILYTRGLSKGILNSEDFEANSGP